MKTAKADKKLAVLPQSAAQQTKPVSPAEAAQITAVEKINNLFASIQNRASTIAEQCIEVVNESIQLAFYLEMATGAKQLTLFHFTSLPGLNDQITYDFAAKCVSMKNRLGPDYKCKSMAEAMPEVKLLFVGIGLVDGTSREPTMRAPVTTVWCRWIMATFSGLNKKHAEMIKKEPMEMWDSERMDTFMAQSKFVHDEHERCAAIRAKTIDVR